MARYRHTYYWLYKLKSKKRLLYPECAIYAGHGSFMLFTNAFVQHYPALQFPGFMYAEEIFFAELVRIAQLKVIYTPQLRIHNIGNINTGEIETWWRRDLWGTHWRSCQQEPRHAV